MGVTPLRAPPTQAEAADRFAPADPSPLGRCHRVLGMISHIVNRSSLTHFAWLSIAAAILTIGLKVIAYLLIGSVGLLSDALESFVNLVD